MKNAVERLIVRQRGSVLDVADLPAEIQRPPQPAGSVTSATDALYDRLVSRREDFWTLVYPAFMVRDLTRADVRALVTRGLEQTAGSYKQLAQLFNMPPREYKRFLNFLRKHECQVPFHGFRGPRERSNERANPAPPKSDPSEPGRH